MKENDIWDSEIRRNWGLKDQSLKTKLPVFRINSKDGLSVMRAKPGKTSDML